MGLAQSRTVSGLITGADDGSPLPGANVLALPSGTGTVSGGDGRFTLNLKPGDDSLKVTFIGYKSNTLSISTISNLANVSISLAPEAKMLDETVVIGYGTQRKSDLTGSVVSVKEADLVKVPSASPLQALQGKAAGVTVTSTSGDPGSAPIVRIRGVGTITRGAGPIYVVDGVIVDDINFLSSNDIASMEVLKDASATAIYGSRGANGVIIVTTKRGKQGKPVFSLSGELGLQTIPNYIDVMNGREFAEYVNAFNPGEFQNLDRVANTDWQDLVYKDVAPLYSANFSVAGATEKTNYYVGLSLFDQEGVLPKSRYQRFSVKVNNEYTVADWFRLGNNITISKEDKQNAPGVVANLVRAWPTEVPYNPDGSYAEVLGGGNPIAAIEYTNSENDQLFGVGNVYGEVDIIDNLTFKSNFGFDKRIFESTVFTPEYFVSATQQSEQSRVEQTKEDYGQWLWEQTLSYNKEIGLHRFDVLAGFTSQSTFRERIKGTVEDIIDYDPSLWYLQGGNIADVTIEQGLDSYRMVSYLFRANYAFDNRYLFTATFRRDGSTKFGENKRYGNFPSFATGWNIHNEEFMKGITLLNRLKLRASWGIIGNEKIPYLEQYSTVAQTYTAVFGANEVTVPGGTYDRSGNPNLQWESTEQTDIGLEFGLLNNRLSGELDYYKRVTRKALVPLVVPGHLG
ncbi:MAG TPA: TonB-dependent receptor, partial [Cryomorphaceae bacterium]|nr:TonB-dependent receptor [Cryomorphaceae bacterium]